MAEYKNAPGYVNQKTIKNILNQLNKTSNSVNYNDESLHRSKITPPPCTNGIIILKDLAGEL